MKVLVTGAAGFVGSTLVERLLAEGEADVVGIDSFSDYYRSEIKERNVQSLESDSFTLVRADLNAHDLDDLLSGVTHIFHQAGQPGVRLSWGSEFSHYTAANVAATQSLLEAATRQGRLESFVYASSSSVYGDAEAYPTRETDRPMPLSPYGVTKLAGEHLCSLYGRNFGLPTVSLRYFTVYGPRQRPDMAFNRFIRAAMTGDAVTVYGDGEQIREFTHVDDIVSANLLAARADLPPGSVINLSGGSAVTVNEVLSVLGTIHGAPLRTVRLPPVAGDVRRTGGSTDRALELLGWAPSVPIDAGLASEYQWMSGVLPLMLDPTN